jgi:hypothetical protein
MMPTPYVPIPEWKAANVVVVGRVHKPHKVWHCAEPRRLVASAIMTSRVDGPLDLVTASVHHVNARTDMLASSQTVTECGWVKLD